MSPPAAVVALMIGELDYMPLDRAQGRRVLNRISTAIVARAVAVWREAPGSVLICESMPMAAEAIRLGVDPGEVVTALPQPLGHSSRRCGWRRPVCRAPRRARDARDARAAKRADLLEGGDRRRRRAAGPAVRRGRSGLEAQVGRGVPGLQRGRARLWSV